MVELNNIHFTLFVLGVSRVKFLEFWLVSVVRFSSYEQPCTPRAQKSIGIVEELLKSVSAEII